VAQGCDVEPTPTGWLVATRDGLAWVDQAGRATGRVSLDEHPMLTPHDEGVWAILAHRVLWLDAQSHRIVGGMVVPNAGRALPVPPEGQSGR